MCGRIAYYSDSGELESFLETKIRINFIPSYNICPTDDVLILREYKKPEIAKWGLTPAWMKDKSGLLINAKSETIREKPSFRDSYKKRRCVVLANGYFEWKREKGSSPKPYYIKSATDSISPFAAIYEEGDGKVKICIITKQANEQTSIIHDRMPVILTKDNISIWLAKESKEDLIDSLLKPAYENLITTNVGKAVGDVRNKGKECIGE